VYTSLRACNSQTRQNQLKLQLKILYTSCPSIIFLTMARTRSTCIESIRSSKLACQVVHETASRSIRNPNALASGPTAFRTSVPRGLHASGLHHARAREGATHPGLPPSLLISPPLPLCARQGGRAGRQRRRALDEPVRRHLRASIQSLLHGTPPQPSLPSTPFPGAHQVEMRPYRAFPPPQF
jgi:hypothetical protein